MSIYNEANDKLHSGDFVRAIELYNKVIAEDDKFMKGYINRGVSYFQLGNFDKAIADFDIVLNMDSQNIVVYNNRGLAYCNKAVAEGDKMYFEKAAQDFRAALKINPAHKTIKSQLEAVEDKLREEKEINNKD